MEKIDLLKEQKTLYGPSAREVSLVEVPAMRYLCVDGEGDPNVAPAYAEAVEALFSVSYTVKFLVKKGPLALDYGVMPLEGLWWADDITTFSVEDKSAWKWTMLIRQPDFVPQETIDAGIAKVQARKNLPALERLYVEAFAEGTCAQILHIGPFSDEGPTIERVHQFIQERGELSGKHHEIYLSDIRRADPSKWRTIVRQPLRFSNDKATSPLDVWRVGSRVVTMRP